MLTFLALPSAKGRSVNRRSKSLNGNGRSGNSSTAPASSSRAREPEVSPGATVRIGLIIVCGPGLPFRMGAIL